MYFENELNKVLSEGRTQTFYKGMTLPNFEKFQNHRIPGFMADLGMALIYSDPVTMGKKDVPRVIISTKLNTDDIEDLCGEVNDMCGSWQNPNHPKHAELRSKIWWADSGGHGKRGIYVGQPVDYQVLFQANDAGEFRRIINSDEIQRLLKPHHHLSNREDAHWSEFA